MECLILRGKNKGEKSLVMAELRYLRIRKGNVKNVHIVHKGKSFSAKLV